ncbi:MAG: SpoIID/LytB domain-containing protein, partial [Bacteroides sp.]|nr:SpoIID/LytB domain-containing protein [Bacteroides sp.]
MKEPKVHVGILSDKQIKFVLPTYYEAQGSYCQGVVTRCKVVSGEQEVTYDDGEIQWDGLSYESLVFIPFDYDNDAFELKDVTIGVNFHWERKENQRFQGALKFIVEDEKLTAVNLINVEDYLTSVISSEMSATAS